MMAPFRICLSGISVESGLIGLEEGVKSNNRIEILTERETSLDLASLEERKKEDVTAAVKVCESAHSVQDFLAGEQTCQPGGQGFGRRVHALE